MDISAGVTDDPVKVFEYLNRRLRDADAGLTVSADDLTRYGAIVEDLVTQIRSSESEALWYDRVLRASWAWD